MEEKMKKEQLLEIGLNDEQIAEVFRLNGLDIENLKNENQILTKERDDLSEKLGTANKKIDEFTSLDVESIKKEAEDYKAKFEETEKKSKENMEQLKTEFEIDKAIISSGAKNTIAVKSLLDLEVLKESKNLKDDIKAQIDNLKEKEGYLFETKEPIKVVSKSNGNLNNEMSKDEFETLGYLDRVALKKENEELYNKLKGE